MKYYSEIAPQVLEERGRLRIAKQIKTVFAKEVGSLNKLTCLEVGSSNGIISNYLAPYFKKYIATDVDEVAIQEGKKRFKNKKLTFKVMSGEDLKFKDNSFDILICNQVYQCVNNPKKLSKEMYRVLKPGGAVFFGGRNQLSFLEGQTGLPLIHFLPESLAVALAKMFNIKYFPVKCGTIWQVKKLFSNFEITNLNPKILKYPSRYGFVNLKKIEPITKLLPIQFLDQVDFLVPNFIFILRKKK
jgi:ubiquinone/menaquinone biosynthesis C-methylase UbiE